MLKTAGIVTTGFAADIEKLLETQEIFDWLQVNPNLAHAFFWNYEYSKERRAAILEVMRRSKK